MNKRLFGPVLCLLLVLTMSMPVFAAKKIEKEPVEIATVEQLLAFGEACRLDTYSEELTVQLTADLDLTAVDFDPIPIFSGTFEGGGHRISGLRVEPVGSVQGLFRYVTEGAVIRDLTLEGEILSEGGDTTLGGIVGSNGGTIMNCKFLGTVSGGETVGGIVGHNQVTGVIESCTAEASIAGVHFAGGLCGVNEGVVRESINRGRVNTASKENVVELTDITIESLTNSDSAATSTDLGGIAGKNSGVIRSCINYGAIGYRQMGHNVGGISGTQSGYITECENHGAVSGRREVGGIVGQMEPMSKIEYSRDTLQILEGQLSTLSGLANRASGNVQNSAGTVTNKLGQLRDQAETAKDAVEILLPGGSDDLDSVIAAQAALADSLGSMSGTMNEITSATKNTTSALTRDLQAISNQINAMGNTISAASRNMGGTFTDVSDSDTTKDLGGKVQACVNYGSVLGDRNVGGITGAMAMENDLSPEDDWTVSGDHSMNVSTQLRAVLLDCENYGGITVHKADGGGIVGWQYLGLVRGCINAGNVLGTAADYVGGVVGRSSGYLRESSAKCSVEGSSYVGGIAGEGSIVTDCRSVTLVKGAGERVGGVLGVATALGEKDAVVANYYMVIDSDLGAVDGISYGGKAEPKDHAAFLSLAEIPEPLRTVTVRFVYENRKTEEVVLPMGGSLTEDMIPPIPAKEGYAGVWNGLGEADLSEVLFDMEFTLHYVGQNVVLESDACRENGRPVLLVQGAFASESFVIAEESKLKPDAGFNQTVSESWDVKISAPEQVTAVRFSVPANCNADRMEIKVRDREGQWRTVAFHADGSYVVFAFGDTDSGFAVLSSPDMMPVLAVLAVGAVLLVWQHRTPGKRKKNT